MKGSKYSRRKHARLIKPLTLLLIVAFNFALMLSVSFDVYAADGIGGTAFTSDYASQDEVYNAANELNITLAEEGFVLLKNDDNALPLSSGAMINVFGKNSAEIAIGGTGSSTGDGSFEAAQAMSLYESLEGAGFQLNPDLVSFYEDDAQSGAGRVAPAMGSNLTGLATGETPQSMYSEALKATYANYADASIVVITRIGGEGYDLPTTMLSGGATMVGSDEGDHYLELDLNEEAIFAALEADASVDNVVVIINASQQMELGFLNDSVNYSKVKAALWVGGPGQSGVAAIGSVLSGSVNPSGHLVDTYIADFKTDPVWYNFGTSGNLGKYGTVADDVFTAGNRNFVDYEEGIYLGYRYWETVGFDAADNWEWYDDHVVYPFGYGLSYTSFSWSLVSTDIPVTLNESSVVEIVIEVENTGSVSGKDVVQLYYTAPYFDGGIEKSYVRLADFAKTSELAPGASEQVTLSVALKDLAAYDYDDANGNGFKGFELEAGDYALKVLKNANARSTNGVSDITLTVPVAVGNVAAGPGATGIMFTHDEVTGTEIKNLFDDVSQKAINGTLADPDTQAVKDSGGFMNVMSRASADGGLAGTIPTNYPDQLSRTVSQVFLDSIGVPGSIADRALADEGQPWYRDSFPTQAVDENGVVTVYLKDLMGLDYEDPLWDTFMNQMTYKEMATLIGDGAFHTIPIDRLGKPYSIEVDGPVGLVPRQEGGPLDSEFDDDVACVYATEPVVAATWNKDLVFQYGEMTGEEGIWGNTAYAYSGIYAPGLNIHRSPFSGRNGEYYSEDGVLSGIMAAQFTKGAQSKGLNVMMKHYALNDQETNRSGVLTWADEQTMREIYFLPFEKAIKNGAQGAMAAYNNIGTKWTGASYALMTELTREEWGFHGYIITDWGSYSTNTEWMIRTGVDLLLGGSGAGVLIYEGEGLTATQAWALRRASKSIMYAVANSNAMIPRLSYANAETDTVDFREGVPYTVDVSGAGANYELDNPLVVTYSAEGLPSQLTLDPATGIVSGTPQASSPWWWRPQPPTSYTFTITATVEAGSTINTSVSQEFTINRAELVDNQVLNSGYVGVPYFSDAIQFTPTAEGEVTYTLRPAQTDWWGNITAPASELPDGLIMTSDGVISGTPTTAGTTDFVVVISSAGIPDLIINKSITIFDGDAIVFESSLLNDGQVGSAYSATLSASGVENITFASEDLPAGLSLDASGAISGTPTAAGNYFFTVIASAEGSSPVHASFALVVVPRDGILFNGALLAEGQVNVAYDASVSASGPAAITYASSDLPAGLSIDASGAISGTPTVAGTHYFTVTASAAGVASVDASFVLVVNPIPVIVFDGSMLADGQVDSAYSASVSASGASGITFASSNLPAGLSIDASGAISGTPTAAGTYYFTITASATGLVPVESSFVLVVDPAPVIAPPVIVFNGAMLTAGEVDAEFSASVSASGAENITFTSSDLPAGLTLNANGTISGMPTEAGVHYFTITASANGAESVDASFVINVVEAATGCGSAITMSSIITSLVFVAFAGLAVVVLIKRK